MISGIVLALFLKIPQYFWDVHAYNLLFEVSYIPYINQLRPQWLIRGIFHFSTCIFSLIILYHILKYFKKETYLLAYILIIGIGSTLLYFLTLFPDNTPPITDYTAWFFLDYRTYIVQFNRLVFNPKMDGASGKKNK